MCPFHANIIVRNIQTLWLPERMKYGDKRGQRALPPIFQRPPSTIPSLPLILFISTAMLQEDGDVVGASFAEAGAAEGITEHPNQEGIKAGKTQEMGKRETRDGKGEEQRVSRLLLAIREAQDLLLLCPELSVTPVVLNEALFGIFTNMTAILQGEHVPWRR